MGENICKIISIAGFEGKKPVYEEIGRMLCNGYWLKSYEENYMQSKVTLEFIFDYCYAAFRTVPEATKLPATNHDPIRRIENLESYNKEQKLIKKAEGRFKDCRKQDFIDNIKLAAAFYKGAHIPIDQFAFRTMEALKILQEGE